MFLLLVIGVITSIIAMFLISAIIVLIPCSSLLFTSAKRTTNSDFMSIRGHAVLLHERFHDDDKSGDSSPLKWTQYIKSDVEKGRVDLFRTQEDDDTKRIVRDSKTFILRKPTVPDPDFSNMCPPPDGIQYVAIVNAQTKSFIAIAEGLTEAQKNDCIRVVCLCASIQVIESSDGGSDGLYSDISEALRQVKMVCPSLYEACNAGIIKFACRHEPTEACMIAEATRIFKALEALWSKLTPVHSRGMFIVQVRNRSLEAHEIAFDKTERHWYPTPHPFGSTRLCAIPVAAPPIPVLTGASKIMSIMHLGRESAADGIEAAVVATGIKFAPEKLEAVRGFMSSGHRSETPYEAVLSELVLPYCHGLPKDLESACCVLMEPSYDQRGAVNFLRSLPEELLHHRTVAEWLIAYYASRINAATCEIPKVIAAIGDGDKGTYTFPEGDSVQVVGVCSEGVNVKALRCDKTVNNRMRKAAKELVDEDSDGEEGEYVYLFHGTRWKSAGDVALNPSPFKSRENVDFGKALYVTKHAGQAACWAFRGDSAWPTEDPPVVVVWKVPKSLLEDLSIRVWKPDDDCRAVIRGWRTKKRTQLRDWKRKHAGIDIEVSPVAWSSDGDWTRGDIHWVKLRSKIKTEEGESKSRDTKDELARQWAMRTETAVSILGHKRTRVGLLLLVPPGGTFVNNSLKEDKDESDEGVSGGGGGGGRS